MMTLFRAIVVASIGAFLLGIFTMITFGFIISIPVMWLWDWLMPVLFGLPEITLWQSWGLLVLCGFLFKTSSKLETNTEGKKKGKKVL